MQCHLVRMQGKFSWRQTLGLSRVVSHRKKRGWNVEKVYSIISFYIWEETGKKNKKTRAVF